MFSLPQEAQSESVVTIWISPCAPRSAEGAKLVVHQESAALSLLVWGLPRIVPRKALWLPFLLDPLGNPLCSITPGSLLSSVLGISILAVRISPKLACSRALPRSVPMRMSRVCSVRPGLCLEHRKCRR